MARGSTRRRRRPDRITTHASPWTQGKPSMRTSPRASMPCTRKATRSGSTGWLERWGINPTATFKLSEFTKVRLSYENFHDARTADRGNPSLATSPLGSRFNPAAPFAPNGDLTAFFGSPNLNFARADVNTVMAFLEHDFANGLTVKNGT